jgi:hypothetical protein
MPSGPNKYVAEWATSRSGHSGAQELSFPSRESNLTSLTHKTSIARFFLPLCCAFRRHAGPALDAMYQDIISVDILTMEM